MFIAREMPVAAALVFVASSCATMDIAPEATGTTPHVLLESEIRIIEDGAPGPVSTPRITTFAGSPATITSELNAPDGEGGYIMVSLFVECVPTVNQGEQVRIACEGNLSTPDGVIATASSSGDVGEDQTLPVLLESDLLVLEFAVGGRVVGP